MWIKMRWPRIFHMWSKLNIGGKNDAEFEFDQFSQFCTRVIDYPNAGNRLPQAKIVKNGLFTV